MFLFESIGIGAVKGGFHLSNFASSAAVTVAMIVGVTVAMISS